MSPSLTSVVIPTYNRSGYLVLAVGSARSGGAEVEVIVFDPEIPGAEGWLLWVTPASRAQFLRVGKPTVWMRVHSKGTFGEPFEFGRSLMLIAEKVIETGLPESVGISGERIIAIDRIHSAYAHYLSGHSSEAWKFFSLARRAHPAVLKEPDTRRVLGRLCVGALVGTGGKK